MATVHWPGRETERKGVRFKALRSTPFILTASEDYPDAINDYIYERVRGKVPALHGADDNLVLEPLGRAAAKKLAYGLADLLTWAETEQAHPSIGVIDWRAIRAWHIGELYQDALLQGYWSAHFFRYQAPSPLNPRSVKQKISSLLGCFVWMSKNGLISEFDYEPQIQIIESAKRASLLSYRREMRQSVANSVSTPQRAFRKAPGSLPLPSLEHLQRFFAALPKGAPRLVAMQLFETGKRAEELVENTLLPGTMHQRDMTSGKWYVHPDWPTEPYRLEYSLSDDRMIGVLPTRDAAWFEEARFGYQCGYRILGKFKKIRMVHTPPKLLRRIWTYVDSKERGDLVAVRRNRGLGDSAHVYLNRFGEKLSYHAIWEAFDRANAKLKAPVDLTPHLMRHAFACYFLERSIIEQAHAMGLAPHDLPPEIVMQIGSTVLLTVQHELGHSEFETTKKYLVQIATGRIRMQALEVWNTFLDQFEILDG